MTNESTFILYLVQFPGIMNKKYYETEQRILCYTIDYLDQNSAASLYNNRICNDLKISKHTFYDHFGNIACLYEKVIDFIQDSQKSFMEEHYDINHHDIKEFITCFLDYLDDHRNYLTAYNKIKEDHGFSLVSSLFEKYLFINKEDEERIYQMCFFCGGVIRLLDEFFIYHKTDRERLTSEIVMFYKKLILD